jgi:hypothetical protein
MTVGGHAPTGRVIVEVVLIRLPPQLMAAGSGSQH